MHLLWIIIIGLIVGAIARFLMPRDDPGGIVVTILLGIAGSFFGTLAGRAIGLYSDDGSAGLIMSVIGAMLLLLLYRVFGRSVV